MVSVVYFDIHYKILNVILWGFINDHKGRSNLRNTYYSNNHDKGCRSYNNHSKNHGHYNHDPNYNSHQNYGNNNNQKHTHSAERVKSHYTRTAVCRRTLRIHRGASVTCVT